jgi:hypothetical protein
MQEPGWPDLYVSSKYFGGFIELKMSKGELSTAQKLIGRKLERNGAFVVLRYVDEQYGNIESADGELYAVVQWTNAKLLLDSIGGAMLRHLRAQGS